MTTSDSQLLDRLADAALSLAGRCGWRGVSVRDLAEEAGVSMAELYGQVRSRDDVLAHVTERLDAAASRDLELDRGASPRERIFDAAMARFDAMEAVRAGLAPILQDERSRAGGRLRAPARLIKSARWVLELAGEDTSGLPGTARARGFALILSRAEEAWIGDGAGDLSRTMRRLDADLRDLADWRDRLEGLGERIKSRSRPQKARPDTHPESTPESAAPGSDEA